MYSALVLLSLFFCTFFENAEALTVAEGTHIKEYLGKLFKSSRKNLRNVWLPSKVLRLAFHDAATFRSASGDGGSHAVMRGECIAVDPENCEPKDPDNAGLQYAVDEMEKVAQKFSGIISHADLWQLAANVVVEHTRGPQLEFAWGRVDYGPEQGLTGKLPAASADFDELMTHFGDEAHGLTPEEVVAVSGAHTLGFLHSADSGHTGQWDGTPKQFDTQYFEGLKRVRTQLWPKQKNGDFRLILSTHIMLPSDAACFDTLPKTVELFAQNEEAFFHFFASGWKKIQNAGHDNLQYLDLPPLSQKYVRRRQIIPNFFGTPEAKRFEIPKIGVAALPTPPFPSFFPKIEVPKIEVPKIEVPKIEVPKIEVPKIEVPKIEMPKLKQPKLKQPKLKQPKLKQLKLKKPKLKKPKWASAEDAASQSELAGEQFTTTNSESGTPGYAIALLVVGSIICVLLIVVITMLTLIFKQTTSETV